jgi:hypothetical protein
MEVEGENLKPVAMESLAHRAVEELRLLEWEGQGSEDEEEGLAGGSGLDRGAAGTSTSTTARASTPSM